MITYAETKKKSILGENCKKQNFCIKSTKSILGADFELKCPYYSWFLIVLSYEGFL